MLETKHYQHICCVTREFRVQGFNSLDSVADVLDRDRRVPAVSHMIRRFFCCFLNNVCTHKSCSTGVRARQSSSVTIYSYYFRSGSTTPKLATTSSTSLATSRLSLSDTEFEKNLITCVHNSAVPSYWPLAVTASNEKYSVVSASHSTGKTPMRLVTANFIAVDVVWRL